MEDSINESRKGDRFVAVAPIDASFGTNDIQVVNLSIGGAQVMHEQPIRIGTKAAFSFVHRASKVAVQVQVVWSHLAQTGDRMLYRTGLKLIDSDIRYATAIHELLRDGKLAKDSDSLDRKRERELERERRRQSGPKVIVPPTT